MHSTFWFQNMFTHLVLSIFTATPVSLMTYKSIFCYSS